MNVKMCSYTSLQTTTHSTTHTVIATFADLAPSIVGALIGALAAWVWHKQKEKGLRGYELENIQNMLSSYPDGTFIVIELFHKGTLRPNKPRGPTALPGVFFKVFVMNKGWNTQNRADVRFIHFVFTPTRPKNEGYPYQPGRYMITNGRLTPAER